jgi:hypothetical protein
MLSLAVMTAGSFTSLHVMGIIFGWTVVAGILVSAMNYMIKVINQKYIVKLPADSPSKKRFSGIMKTIIKVHPYIGLYLLTILLLHFFSVIGHHGASGFSWTGLAAAALLVMQVGVGSYGLFIRSRKRGPWFYVHRTNAALMAAAVIVHVAKAFIWPLG